MGIYSTHSFSPTNCLGISTGGLRMALSFHSRFCWRQMINLKCLWRRTALLDTLSDKKGALHQLEHRTEFLLANPSGIYPTSSDPTQDVDSRKQFHRFLIKRICSKTPAIQAHIQTSFTAYYTYSHPACAHILQYHLLMHFGRSYMAAATICISACRITYIYTVTSH